MELASVGQVLVHLDQEMVQIDLVVNLLLLPPHLPLLFYDEHFWSIEREGAIIMHQKCPQYTIYSWCQHQLFVTIAELHLPRYRLLTGLRFYWVHRWLLPDCFHRLLDQEYFQIIYFFWWVQSSQREFFGRLLFLQQVENFVVRVQRFVLIVQQLSVLKFLYFLLKLRVILRPYPLTSRAWPYETILSFLRGVNDFRNCYHCLGEYLT